MEITFEVVKGEQTFRKNARILQNYADSNSSYVLGVLFINVKHPSFILIDKYDDKYFIVCNKTDINKYYSIRYVIIGEVD